MNLDDKTPDNYGLTLIRDSLFTGEAIMDDSMMRWEAITDLLIENSSKVIALRGAGSWNGMDKVEADNLIENQLIPRISEQLKSPGQVTILFDGDYDRPEKPDLGYVAGRLIDHFGNVNNRVIFLVAQKESWHPDELEDKNLVNSNGRQYITYLFPDKKYEGDHSSFTQSRRLVNSGKYEQWYLGASGQIANSQLTDFNDKVDPGKVGKSIIFRVKNNSALEYELTIKLEQAEKDNNEKAINNFKNRIQQREKIYGEHWNNDGSPNIQLSNFPKLDIEFVP